MHTLRLHILGTVAAIFIAMFVVATPAHATSQTECEDQATADQADCEVDANLVLSGCGGTPTECQTQFALDLAVCGERRTQTINDTCANLTDITDSQGFCNFGADKVYGGCYINKDKDKTNAPTTAVCNGFVDGKGACNLNAATTGSSSGDTSIAVQYQSIQNQGIIFGNICTSRAAQCECRDLGNCSLDDVLQVVVNISVLILGLSGSLVLLMFVYGGFLWLTSHGNETMVTEGKKTMTGALVGLLIVFGSYAAITSFISVLKSGEVPLSTDTKASPNLIEVLEEEALTGAAGSSAAPGTGVTKPKDIDESSGNSSSSSNSDSSLQGLADAAGGALSGAINSF